MKVPTYTRQTGLTTKTGATAFSVRANPGALSAGLSGLTTLANAAQDYAVNEVKERRQNELTQKENEYKLKLQELQVEMSQTDPTIVMQGDKKNGILSYDERAREIRNNLGLEIDSKIVRKRFNASATQEAFQERISVMQDARNREIDKNKATKLQAAELLFRDVTQGSGNKKTNALAKLFGGSMPTGPSGMDTEQVTGIFDEMASRGLITNTQAVQYTQKYKQRIDKSDSRNRLIQADKSGDPAQAAQLIQDLGNPANFANMTQEDRDTALKQAVDMEQALRKRQLSQLEKQERLDKKAQKNRHDTTSRTMLSKIQKFRADPTEANRAAIPTLVDIADALVSDQIDDTQAKLLTGLINDEDADQRDPDLIMSIFQGIGNAQDADEVAEQTSRITPNMGTGGSIPLDDALKLQRYADSKLTKTRESDDIKFYGDQLDDLTGQTAFRLGKLGVGQDEIERQLDAADTYRRLVLDPDKPMKPRDAYQMVGEQFERARRDELNFLAPAAFLERHFDNATPDTWTIEMVDNARASIRTNQNMSQLEKALEFETLDLIVEKISIRDAELVPGDPQVGDAPEGSFFQRLFNRNRNDSLRDRERDIRNPE